MNYFKDVSVQFGDQDLIPLPPSHILRQKLDAPEALRVEALQSPGDGDPSRGAGQVLRDTIAAAYGPTVAEHMLALPALAKLPG